MNRTVQALSAAAILLLPACASTPPTQFYTLMPVAPASPAAVSATPLRIEVLPVSIPAQVDRPQLVVREGDGRIVPVETRRWIAPLADEIRGALSADLDARLGAQEVHGMPGATPDWRIALDVRRFDSALGAYARIDALWSLRSADDKVQLTCASNVSETVAPGYAELAQGHQRALARIAADIAAALRAAQNSDAVLVCPARHD